MSTTPYAPFKSRNTLTTPSSCLVAVWLVGALAACGVDGEMGPAGPPGEHGTPGADGDTGAANISGTTNHVVRFTGATSGGDGVLLDDGTNAGIGSISGAYAFTIDIPAASSATSPRAGGR